MMPTPSTNYPHFKQRPILSFWELMSSLDGSQDGLFTLATLTQKADQKSQAKAEEKNLGPKKQPAANIITSRWLHR